MNKNKIKPSWRAKEMGAKTLKEVAEFYQCSTKHLRDVCNRNLKAFDAMIYGYLRESDRE